MKDKREKKNRLVVSVRKLSKNIRDVTFSDIPDMLSIFFFVATTLREVYILGIVIHQLLSLHFEGEEFKMSFSVQNYELSFTKEH